MADPAVAEVPVEIPAAEEGLIAVELDIDTPEAPAAEVPPAEQPVEEAVEVVEPYTLRVQFTDATEQIINLKPVLAGELYGPLLDLQLFNQVAIDAEVKTLVWPNGADFDPATLHDWPEYKDAFAARAREWERVSA